MGAHASSGLRGIPEVVDGFDVEAVDYALEATGVAASDISGPSADDVELGGLETSVDVDEGLLGLDRRVAIGLAVVAIVAIAWGGS